MTQPNKTQHRPIIWLVLAALSLIGLSIPQTPALANAVYSALLASEPGANDFRISDMGADGATNIFGFDAAVADNSTNNEYLVVWAGDDAVDNAFEIYGQRINASTGAEVGTNDFRISDMGALDSNTNFRADTPAVAYNSTNNEYLVVWRGDDGSGGLADDELEIFGQRLNAATGAEVGTNDFRISDMGADGDFLFNAFDPAVTYSSTNNEYLVVWWGDDTTNNANEIYGQRLNAASGGETGSNDFRISDMGTLDTDTNFRAQNPAVAYNSSNNEYLVVWEGDDNTAPLVDDEFEIYGQRLNAATGAETGSNDFRISDMGAFDTDTNFRASGATVVYNSFFNSYLVAWRGDDDTDFGNGPLVNDELEIFGQEIDAAGVEKGPNDFRISDMGPDQSSNFSADKPDVAYSSSANEFLVVWQGDDNVVTINDEVEIFGQRVGPDSSFLYLPVLVKSN